MRLAVIFIATAFEVRLKDKDRSFLKQHERFKMAGMLDELSRWISETVHSPEVAVMTCFDEIYELCIRRHIKVVRNEFGQISEGNMIRAGMLAMPGFENYLIISASEPRLIKTELLENLCSMYISQSGKTTVTKYRGKLQLPIIFSIKNTDPVNSMLDKDKGRFVLRSSQKDVVFYEASEEFLGSGDKDKKVKDYLSGVSIGLTGEDTHADVVVIRGAGKVGSGIALALFEAGWYVLMTEKEEPDTLFRGMSFAYAVKEGEMTVNGVTGYLVSPSIRQLEKAWRAGVIPIVIDPDFSSVGLFGSHDKAALSDEIEKAALEIDGAAKTYGIAAVIDCTSIGSGAAFPEKTDIITVGVKGTDYGKTVPKYLIETSFDLHYGKVNHNKDIKLLHIGPNSKGEEYKEERAVAPNEMYSYIKAPVDGRFREIKRIGDTVRANDLVGQIVSSGGERTDIFASVSGRIAGDHPDNSLCLAGDVICAIDPFAYAAEDCFSQSPLGMLPGISIRKLLDEVDF